jgi:hypothetical protein
MDSQSQNQELFGLLVSSNLSNGALRNILTIYLLIFFVVFMSFVVVNF